MQIDFTGRRVLISGSTSGIGFAAATGFLKAGASVVINGRTEQSVAAALKRLEEHRSRVIGFAGDLATLPDCSRLVAEHPDFDVVINNLGVSKPQDFFDTPDSEWDRLFQTNV